MQFPNNCKYTADHEWLRLEGDNTAYIGITDFAQGELGEIVYVEVNTVGDTLNAHEVFGAVEAVKTTSDLFLPVAAKILEINSELDGNPDLVNTDPYGKGWIVKVEIQDPAEVEGLMAAEAYQALVGG
jgi:glycine cleavage system H protein